MKLTKQVLKSLIQEVIGEKKKNSMILQEIDKKSKYDRIISTLEGRQPEIKTVGMMSGQNPMVRSVSPEENARRKKDLEAALKKRGLKFERIGAEFGGHPEQSVLIMNPSQFDMDVLCRMFQQWGFVWGERFPMNKEQDFMGFTMYMIDYDQDMGWKKDPKSKETGRVIKNDEMQGEEDFSIDPTSGKKFGLEMYEGK
tara:strand:- start:4800 stop:5393 length:594 start_codon:yes stop_codon:yes gene_type:complete